MDCRGRDIALGILPVAGNTAPMADLGIVVCHSTQPCARRRVVAMGIPFGMDRDGNPKNRGRIVAFLHSALGLAFAFQTDGRT
jgi:hypothetical protein